MNTPQEFLASWCKNGPWILTAIHPATRQIHTQQFNTLNGIQTWIQEHRAWNHYFQVNRSNRDMDKKSSKTDILCLDCLHVDIDFRTPEDKETILERLRNHSPKPSVVVFSGGGYQAFWFLEKAILLDGSLETAEDAALWNKQLELTFNADACHNVDRVMRLPFTMNYPTAVKQRKGRVPVLATVEWFENVRYPLSAFTKAVTVASGNSIAPAPMEIGNVEYLPNIDALDSYGKVPDNIKLLIVQGKWDDTMRDINPDADNSRSGLLWAACCEMARCGVPREVMYAVLTDKSFGISESIYIDNQDRQRNSRELERYALRQIDRAYQYADDPDLLHLNEKYAVVGNTGGKCRILEEVPCPVLNRSMLTLQSFADFKNRYCNRWKEIAQTDAKGKPAPPKFIPLGAWWINHAKRRQYDGITFAPNRDINGVYNMWQGFACDAIPGDCSLYLNHVLDNICCRKTDHYQYLLSWMANAAQSPGEPAETAVVIRGEPGTGKSFFIRHFGRLFGRHFMQVSNSAHLVGQFNSHLQDCVVLFGDEAFYAGDKKHESVLKMLITEDTLTIERKGIDAQSHPNCLHMMLASNESWVVPVNMRDRRFFVLNTSTDYMQDHAYFGAIEKQMNSGGKEALLHFLLNYDLSGFQKRAIPLTTSLRRQKEHSMSEAEAWWFEILKQGILLSSHSEWTGEAESRALQRSFILACKRGNAKLFGQTLKTVLHVEQVPRRKASFSVQTVELDGRPIEVKRPYFYQFPSLEECRALWDKYYFPYEWDFAVVEADHPNDAEDGGGAY